MVKQTASSDKLGNRRRDNFARWNICGCGGSTATASLRKPKFICEENVPN